MVQAQDWLNNTFPSPVSRKKITHLLVSAHDPTWLLLEDGEEPTNTWKKFKAPLEGTLDLNDFVNLEKLYLGGGSLTGLKINQCKKLAYLDIATQYFLTSIDIGNNEHEITLKSWGLTPFKSLINKLQLVKKQLKKWTKLIKHD